MMIKKMVFVILSLSLIESLSFSETVKGESSLSVDSSRFETEGFIRITMHGNEGSAVEKLYNTLKKTEVESPFTEGLQQPKAIECHRPKEGAYAFTCTVKVARSGIYLEAWK